MSDEKLIALLSVGVQVIMVLVGLGILDTARRILSELRDGSRNQ